MQMLSDLSWNNCIWRRETSI